LEISRFETSICFLCPTTDRILYVRAVLQWRVDTIRIYRTCVEATLVVPNGCPG